MTVTRTRGVVNTLSRNSRNLENAGHFLMRYGVMAILLWVGLLKFTRTEAEGIRPFIVAGCSVSKLPL